MRGNEQKTQGLTVALEPAKTQIFMLSRVNIAERLYRVTGESIYHDAP